MSFRVGIGYDVHQMVPGRKLTLGGVDIPYDKGLLGHSDADVLLHAIMDSLLGAMAMGDIGCCFPDNDIQYKDISSLVLLDRVYQLLDEKYTIVNIDTVIVAQRPKLAPYIEAMKEKICQQIHLEKDQLNIKATTEEGLGFTGRGEGIACKAICMLASKI